MAARSPTPRHHYRKSFGLLFFFAAECSKIPPSISTRSLRSFAWFLFTAKSQKPWAASRHHSRFFVTLPLVSFPPKHRVSIRTLTATTTPMLRVPTGRRYAHHGRRVFFSTARHAGACRCCARLGDSHPSGTGFGLARGKPLRRGRLVAAPHASTLGRLAGPPVTRWGVSSYGPCQLGWTTGRGRQTSARQITIEMSALLLDVLFPSNGSLTGKCLSESIAAGSTTYFALLQSSLTNDMCMGSSPLLMRRVVFFGRFINQPVSFAATRYPDEQEIQRQGTSVRQ